MRTNKTIRAEMESHAKTREALETATRCANERGQKLHRVRRALQDFHSRDKVRVIELESATDALVTTLEEITDPDKTFQ